MTSHAQSRAALALVALAAGAVAVAFSWQPGLATFHDDSASYLVMAQAFSPWHAAAAPVLAQMPYEKYPPAFPALLALAGAAYDWRWAHAIVAASFAASIWFLGVHAQRSAASAAAGLIVAVLYAALPGAWLNMKGILTEFPYMAITFATLAWLAGRQREPLTRIEAIALGLLLAGAMSTRTIGFTLWLAVGIAEAGRYARARDIARLRSVGASLAIAAAVAGAWYVARPSGGEDAYLTSSVGVLERARADGPGWIMTLAAANAGAIFDAWLNALVIYWGEAWQPRFIAGALLGAGAAAAIAWRAWRLEVDGLYCVLFLAVLVAWPFPGQMYRLALPVIPLAIALAWCALLEVARGRLPAREATRAAWYAAALPLAFCVPALFYIAERARLPAAADEQPPRNDIMEFYRIPTRLSAEASATRQARAFQDMGRIRESTPEAARVMWYGPAYVALLARRTAVPLDYPRDAGDMAAQVKRARPDYIYLSRVHPRDSAQRLGDPLAPARHLAGYTETVWWRRGPDGAPEAALFRVRPERLEPAR